jgi:hypothetical protein
LRFKTVFADAGDDPLDLFFRGVRLGDDDHGGMSGNTIMSSGNGKCKPGTGCSRRPGG